MKILINGNKSSPINGTKKNKINKAEQQKGDDFIEKQEDIRWIPHSKNGYVIAQF